MSSACQVDALVQKVKEEARRKEEAQKQAEQAAKQQQTQEQTEEENLRRQIEAEALKEHKADIDRRLQEAKAAREQQKRLAVEKLQTDPSSRAKDPGSEDQEALKEALRAEIREEMKQQQQQQQQHVEADDKAPTEAKQVPMVPQELDEATRKRLDQSKAAALERKNQRQQDKEDRNRLPGSLHKRMFQRLSGVGGVLTFLDGLGTGPQGSGNIRLGSARGGRG